MFKQNKTSGSKASVGAVVVLPSKPGWLGIWDKPSHQLPEIFTADYPRSFFFRRSETLASSDVVIFSNCDEVRLTWLGKVMGVQKADSALRHMPHPPFIFRNVFDFHEIKGLAQQK